jgi:hypothetical protein
MSPIRTARSPVFDKTTNDRRSKGRILHLLPDDNEGYRNLFFYILYVARSIDWLRVLHDGRCFRHIGVGHNICSKSDFRIRIYNMLERTC